MSNLRFKMNHFNVRETSIIDLSINQLAIIGEGESEISVPKTSVTMLSNNAKGNTRSYKLTGMSKKLIGNNLKFLDAIDRLSFKRKINPAELLGLIASESAFDPKAKNEKTGATGLIQIIPDTAKKLRLTTKQIGEMSATDQVPFIDNYFEMTKLQDNPTKEQLYTSIFLPIYIDQDSNFDLLKKQGLFSDGSKVTPFDIAQYERNKGLDTNKDGIIKIKDLGTKISNKMKEYGIEDLTQGI